MSPSLFTTLGDLPTFQFGGGGTLADELGDLVVQGRKTATCTTLAEYEEKGWPIPKAGDLWVFLDSRGTPIGVIETAWIAIQPVHAVDPQFAYDEGEGDRTLEYWRSAHARYFGGQGRDLSDDTMLVCERFRLVHVF